MQVHLKTFEQFSVSGMKYSLDFFFYNIPVLIRYIVDT